MFKVIVDDVEYEVRFEQYPPPDVDREKFTDEYKFRFCFGTICSIIYEDAGDDEENYTYEIKGISELSIKDQFNRSIGRKVSLTKALKELFPDDANKRKVFWTKYWLVRGGKW